MASGDLELALSLAEELAGRDERAGRLVYPVANRLREVHRVVALLDSGVAEKDLAKQDARAAVEGQEGGGDSPQGRPRDAGRAIVRFADLELELRGGGTLDEDTAFTLALARATAWIPVTAVRVPHSFGFDLGLDVDVLGLLEGLQPLRPSSRPSPDADRLNGPASSSVSGSLIQTVPDRYLVMQRTAVARSRV